MSKCNDCPNKTDDKCCHDAIRQIRNNIDFFKPQWAAYGARLGVSHTMNKTVNAAGSRQFQRRTERDQCIDEICKNRSAPAKLRFGIAVLSIWLMFIVCVAALLIKIFTDYL